MESNIHHAVEAVGTLAAGKTIGLAGVMTAMRERVQEGVGNAKTSGPITITIIFSLIMGAFALGGIVWMIAGQDKKQDSFIVEIRDTLIAQDAKMAKAIADTRAEQTAQIDIIMSSNNANTALLVDSLKEQMALSQKYFSSELKARDFKLKIAYDSAQGGPRYTPTDAQGHIDKHHKDLEEEIEAHHLVDDERYYDIREQLGNQRAMCEKTAERVDSLQEMCKETRARLTELEDDHKGIGFHSQTNGK